MTTTTAGRINPQWLANAQINTEGSDDTVEQQIDRALNISDVEIGADGAVWAVRAGHGDWLSQQQIDDACRAIDAGV